MSRLATPSIAAYESKSAPDLPPNQSSPETNKYITFKLANYVFALPSERILKVVATPPPSQGGMVSMGLVQLEQYSIQTIDLPKMMNLKKEHVGTVLEAKKSDKETALEHTKQSSAEPRRIISVEQEKNPPFLMVMQDADDALWGIAVQEPPDLMDIPEYALKPVPSEKRLSRALRLVSHVVTYDLAGDRHTLLVLDLSVLLSTKPSHQPTEGSILLEIEPPLLKELQMPSKNEDSKSMLELEPPLKLSALEVEETESKKEVHT